LPFRVRIRQATMPRIHRLTWT